LGRNILPGTEQGDLLGRDREAVFPCEKLQLFVGGMEIGIVVHRVAENNIPGKIIGDLVKKNTVSDSFLRQEMSDPALIKDFEEIFDRKRHRAALSGPDIQSVVVDDLKDFVFYFLSISHFPLFL
jgi:hypothetical protein